MRIRKEEKGALKRHKKGQKQHKKGIKEYIYKKRTDFEHAAIGEKEIGSLDVAGNGVSGMIHGNAGADRWMTKRECM